MVWFQAVEPEIATDRQIGDVDQLSGQTSGQ